MTRRPLVRVLAALAFLFTSLAALASDRVALLIGNNNYATGPLRNAVNDAKDLSDALKELGFKVIVRENATRKDMIDGIREFGQALEGAATGLFFYAGHAMQFKDRNYLIPIDAAMGSEEDVTFFSVEISQVFDRMDRARTRFNFIILDACRDNPFAASFKVSSAGLAQMSAPTGTLIAYATAPGAVAADGFGRNGTYTKHILQNIRVPDVPVEIMFKRVREGVERETLKRQTPWDSSSLKGDFAFNSTGRSTAAASAPSGPSADVTLSLEREFWVSVRDSNRADEIEAYLEKYPKGTYATLARNRLDALRKSSRAAPAVAEAKPPVEKPAPTMIAQRDEKPITRAAERPAEKLAEKTPAKSAERVQATPEGSIATPSETQVVVAAAPASAATASAAVPAATAAASIPAPPPAAPRPSPQLGREIAPGIRELTFADGSVYRGGFRGTELHGRGEYVSKAFKYEGEWNNSVKQGQGVYVWDNGNRYEGPFADDRPNGIGKFTFANGDIYTGEVRNGVITGRGTYHASTGDEFEGSFVDGKLQGVGIYRFASGDRYEGEMAQGKPHGRGRYFTKSGDRIEAPFVEGRPQGKGTYHFANGDRYEGELKGSEITGTGSYYYTSGSKYEGQMRQGLPEGKGVFWFVDGSRFEGTFENGLAKARGEIVRPDGARVRAEIVNGDTRLLD